MRIAGDRIGDFRGARLDATAMRRHDRERRSGSPHEDVVVDARSLAAGQGGKVRILVSQKIARVNPTSQEYQELQDGWPTRAAARRVPCSIPGRDAAPVVRGQGR